MRARARESPKILEIVAAEEPKGPLTLLGWTASGRCSPAELSPFQLQAPSSNCASSASRDFVQPDALSPGQRKQWGRGMSLQAAEACDERQEGMPCSCAYVRVSSPLALELASLWQAVIDTSDGRCVTGRLHLPPQWN